MTLDLAYEFGGRYPLHCSTFALAIDGAVRPALDTAQDLVAGLIGSFLGDN